jgi:hypothetical protein
MTNGFRVFRSFKKSGAHRNRGFHGCDGSTRIIRDNPSHPCKSVVAIAPILLVSILMNK